MKENGIQTPFHYQALHQTPYAQKFNPSDCPNATKVSDTLVRLPIYYSMTQVEQDYVLDKVQEYRDFD
jgi:dTDP-4-amino-4,6-dideoxygalactose transaminase